MTRQLEALNSKPELKELLGKFFAFYIADDALNVESHAGVIDGPMQPITEVKDYGKKKVTNFKQCGGLAVVLTALDLSHFAFESQDLFITELHDYAKCHAGWRDTLQNATMENIDANWLPCREAVVLVHDADLPTFATMKTANLALQHWALIWQYVHTIETTSDPSSFQLHLLRRRIKHYPITVEYLKVEPD